MPHKPEYWINKEYYGYTIISPTEEKEKTSIKYYCQCNNCKQFFTITLKKMREDYKRINMPNKKYNYLGCLHIKETKQKGIINDLPYGFTKNEENKKIHTLWRSMINRASPKYWKTHPTYTGTKVCEEWKILSNFVKDIKTFKHYEDWLKDTKHWVLDKDTKNKNGEKLYSKETTCFLTTKQSSQDVASRHKEIYKQNSKSKENLGIKIKLTNLKTKEEKYFISAVEASNFLNKTKTYVFKKIKQEKYIIEDWKIEVISQENYLKLKEQGVQFLQGFPQHRQQNRKNLPVKTIGKNLKTGEIRNFNNYQEIADLLQLDRKQIGRHFYKNNKAIIKDWEITRID